MDTCNKGIFIKVWSKCTRDNIQVVANVALVLILVLNFWSNILQRDTLQVKIFEQIAHDIGGLIKTPPPLDDKEAWILWEKRLMGIYESFAFFANHKYLRREIVNHFGPAVVGDLDVIVKKYPSALEMLRPPFGSELMEFYRNQTGKDLRAAANDRTK